MDLDWSMIEYELEAVQIGKVTLATCRRKLEGYCEAKGVEVPFGVFVTALINMALDAEMDVELLWGI